MHSGLKEHAMRNDLTSTNEPDDRELNAYNAAFYELGLRWHWDSATYETLLSLGDGATRVRHYLQTVQSHLLRAYDVDFLVAMIEQKAIVHRAAADAAQDGRTAPRFFDWAQARGCELGI
jgi:hypothetical protein